MAKGGKDERRRCQKCKWSSASFDGLFWCDYWEEYVDADYSCEEYDNGSNVKSKEEIK